MTHLYFNSNTRIRRQMKYSDYNLSNRRRRCVWSDLRDQQREGVLLFDDDETYYYDESDHYQLGTPPPNVSMLDLSKIMHDFVSRGNPQRNGSRKKKKKKPRSNKRHRIAADSERSGTDNIRNKIFDSMRDRPILLTRRCRSKSCSNLEPLLPPSRAGLEKDDIQLSYQHLHQGSYAVAVGMNMAYPLRCLSQLLPNNCLSVCGPNPRGSLAVTDERRHVAVLLLWVIMPSNDASSPPAVQTNHHQQQQQQQQHVIRVVPLIGDGCNWDTARKMEQVVRQKVSAFSFCSSSLFRTDNKNNSLYLRFWNLSVFLLSNVTEWEQLLVDALSSPSAAEHNTTNGKVTTTRNNALLSSLFKRRGVPCGRSLDSFNRFEILRGRLVAKQKADATSTTTTTDEANREQEQDCNVCLVCYDDISQPSNQLQVTRLVCGHATCSSCWKAYLQSAAKSGRGIVECAAFRCQTCITFSDAAHILFLNGDDDTPASDCPDNSSMNAKLFAQLLDYGMESHVFQEFNDVRHCPSTTCDRLLIAPRGVDTEATTPGWNICACPCGVTICLSCGHTASNSSTSSSSSHPGVSCKAYAKLRKEIDGGRLDAELASIHWVLQNSRPCPKCTYPINKDGGCNHVRCQHCDNYFCWQCGGPGNECMAYHCKKSNQYWYQEPDDYEEDNYKTMATTVSFYRSFREASKNFETLLKQVDRTAGSTPNKLLMLELDLRRVLLWVHIPSISKAVADASSSPPKSNCLQNLELMLHALSLRKRMTKRRGLSDDEMPGESMFSLQEVGAAMGIVQPVSKSRRKLQPTVERQTAFDVAEMDPFQSVVVDLHLQELCTMSNDSFVAASRKAILGGLAYLSTPMAKPKPAKSCTTHNDGTASKTLSKKLSLSKGPWRDGKRRQDGQSINGTKPTKACEVRWKKGKARVSTIRAHALSRFQDSHV